MNNEQHGHEYSAEQNTLLAKLRDLQAEVVRLQQAVRELEEQKTRDARALAEAQEELKEYQRLAYQWASKFCREEDWQDFREEDYTVTAEEFLAELDKWERQ